MTRRARVFAALLLAPPCASISAWLMIVYESLIGQYHGGIVSQLLPYGVMASSVSYLGMLLLGLPAHLWLQRSHRVSWPYYAAAGTILGSVPVFGTFKFLKLESVGKFTLMFGLGGLLVASAFWLIAVRSRDDRRG